MNTPNYTLLRLIDMKEIPVLGHPALSLQNIFVDPVDLKITGILDRQGASVLPYSKHTGFPQFLSNNGKGVSEVTNFHKLPDNLDSLDPDERELQQIAHIQRLSCQLYILASVTYNRQHFEVLRGNKFPLLFELVYRASQSWNGEIWLPFGMLSLTWLTTGNCSTRNTHVLWNSPPRIFKDGQKSIKK